MSQVVSVGWVVGGIAIIAAMAAAVAGWYLLFRRRRGRLVPLTELPAWAKEKYYRPDRLDDECGWRQFRQQFGCEAPEPLKAFYHSGARAQRKVFLSVTAPDQKTVQWYVKDFIAVSEGIREDHFVLATDGQGNSYFFCPGRERAGQLPVYFYNCQTGHSVLIAESLAGFLEAGRYVLIRRGDEKKYRRRLRPAPRDTVLEGLEAEALQSRG